MKQDVCVMRKNGTFTITIKVLDAEIENKTDEEIAKEGLQKMEDYMREIGLVMNISELGVTSEMIDKIAKSTFILGGGYKKLSYDDVVDILQQSM